MADNFPLRLLLATFGGWVNRRQAHAIEYLVEENRVLKEPLGNKRLRLTDDQRRRRAAKGKPIGRRLLDRIATIVTPETILRWHRNLIAVHHTYPHKTRVGRPGLMNSIRELVVANGIAPSPDRPTSWRTFLKSHADVIAAADFFTVDVWTKRGLVMHYVLFVIHHATRAVHIAGITPHPNGEFMAQVARNLTDSVDGFLRNMKFLVVDNDTLFTKQFCSTLANAAVELTRTAIKAPDMNAFAEPWVQTVKRKCLSKLIQLGEKHLRRALNEFVDHYNQDRPHQSLDNNPIQPQLSDPPTEGEIVIDERLGGLLCSYRRSA
tara:strand:- start:1244 stop:2206 length:963 start_codon:yes stop_codon:yes gene_type:complete